MKRCPVLTCLLTLLLVAAEAAADGSSSSGDSVQARTELLANQILPQVAALLLHPDYGPVRIEARNKAELRSEVVPTLRAFYGEEGLERRGRVAAALGLIPPGYDLARGMGELLVEVMGGGYDPLRQTYYTLTDVPSAMSDPQVEKMIVAHELTHALEDQVDDMEGALRRGATDWDHGFVYNAVIEGIAYQTMMAVVADVPLADAPDATAMLLTTRSAMAGSAAFPVYARTPPAVIEMIFGPAMHGLAFFRSYIQAHPQASPLELVTSTPASGEQILHFDRYVAADLPAAIDLSAVEGGVPAAWRPYLAGVLGEFDLRLCLEAHPAARELADEAASGWDGCQFRAYETPPGEIVILGLSVWDSIADATEFSRAFSLALAGGEDPGILAIQPSGVVVSFVIGSTDPVTRSELLARLGAIRITG